MVPTESQILKHLKMFHYFRCDQKAENVEIFKMFVNYNVPLSPAFRACCELYNFILPETSVPLPRSVEIIHTQHYKKQCAKPNKIHNCDTLKRAFKKCTVDELENVLWGP